MNFFDKLWRQSYSWLRAHLFMKAHRCLPLLHPTPLEHKVWRSYPCRGLRCRPALPQWWSFTLLGCLEIRNPYHAVQLWLSACSSVEPLFSAAATASSLFWSPCWCRKAVLPLFLRPVIILVSLSVFACNHVFHQMGAQNWRCFSRCQTLSSCGYLPLLMLSRAASGLWSG